MPNCSRIRQSTSSEEIGVFRAIESPRIFCSERSTQSAPETKKNSESIFTVGSPERDNSGEVKKPAEGFGEFLHNCRFCKRRLTNKFFMYGYLGAFCSHQCRDHQIMLDGFDEEIAKDIQMRLKSAEGVFNSKITNLGFSLDFPGN